MDDQPIAEQAGQFVEKSGIGARLDGVVERDIGVAAHQRPGNAEHRCNANSACDQTIGFFGPVDFEQRGRTGYFDARAWL
jgi:hypothetical protein